MRQAFLNLPDNIDGAITRILSQQEDASWVMRAAALHERYMERSKDGYIHDTTDVLAYLAMRVPATFAQLAGAFSSVAEINPSWWPKTILDIGSGPGTGVWAAQGVWPSLEQAVCIDQETTFLTIGQQITSAAALPVKVEWRQQNLTRGLEVSEQFDLVVLGNVLNELHVSQGEKLLGQAFNACRGVLMIVESGTPFGYGIVQSVAKKLQTAGHLLAPYINGAFVPTEDYWLHFPQRFIRPEFSRRIRQHMRESAKMASDWEEAKYSYVAVGKIEPEIAVSGRVVGPVKVQKGFLEVPVLTADKIETVKVMKREKEKYTLYKELKWGDLL